MSNYVVLSPDAYPRILNGGITYLKTLELRLFQNNFVPTSASLTSDFTECTFHGYAAQTANGWTAPAPNAAPPDEDAQEGIHVFTATDGVVPNTIYGAYLTDPVDGHWIMAEATNVSSPTILDAGGKSYVVTVRLTLTNYQAYP